MIKFLYALLFTILPITELRVGMPLAINYALENNIPVMLVFLIIVFLNILVVFFIFFFLDKIHLTLMKFKIYNKLFNLYLKKIQKKIDKFEKKHQEIGFIALILFVAIPLPGTGAWTGSLLSWILGLDRKKSILAIAIGIMLAGLFIFLASLGFFNYFY